MSDSDRVYMRGVTWGRDSHGLFDYESRNITKQSWTTRDKASIVRIENDMFIKPLSDQNEGQTLIQITKPQITGDVLSVEPDSLESK